MNGVSPKTIKESPKTPGGISKTLLTPCRRVGLSRKWRKSGCSPFISPLSAQNTPEVEVIKERKKVKKCEENEHMGENIDTTEKLDNVNESNMSSPMLNNSSNNHIDITSTPSRNSHVPQKKSKVLSLSLKDVQKKEKQEIVSEKEFQLSKLFEIDKSKNENSVIPDKTFSNETINNTQIEIEVGPIRNPEDTVTKLVRAESKSKKLSLKKALSKSECKSLIHEHRCKPKDLLDAGEPKEKSPNNLTKECIVVIQNKILKTGLNTTSSSKDLQDSDSEPDIPLSTLKRKTVEDVTLNTLGDDDFISKPIKKKTRNLSIKKNKTTNPVDSNSTSQSSQEDIRTIIVKKTYEKVTKPQKAKSTGSITQKDIDDLKARIEMKKKLLLAKSMSIETEELRDLIKKWQKGCQDALMELLALMKKTLPDRQNMDYAEILETLKIPSELVGYDSENDCFVTPEDTNILLSAFKL